MKTKFRKNVNLILIVVIMLITGNFTQAQQRGQQGPPPIPTEKQIKALVNELADEISLTEDQKVHVLDLYLEHFEEVEEKTSGNSRPDRNEMEAFETTFQNEVKTVLSEPQQTQYEAYLKEQADERHRRRSGR